MNSILKNMQNDEIKALLDNIKQEALQDLKNHNIVIDFKEASFDKQELLFSQVAKCIAGANTIQDGLTMVLSSVEITNAIFNCLNDNQATEQTFYKKSNGEIVVITRDALNKNPELKKVFASIKVIGLITNIDFFLLNIIRLLPQSLREQTNPQFLSQDV